MKFMIVCGHVTHDNNSVAKYIFKVDELPPFIVPYEEFRRKGCDQALHETRTERPGPSIEVTRAALKNLRTGMSSVYLTVAWPLFK